MLLRLDDDAAPALQVKPERDVVGDRMAGTHVDVEPARLIGENPRQVVILEVLRIGQIHRLCPFVGPLREETR
jgi:hypothetical protein